MISAAASGSGSGEEGCGGLASSHHVVPGSYLDAPSGFQEGRFAAVSRLGRPCEPIGTDLGFREDPHQRSIAEDSLTLSSGRRSCPLGHRHYPSGDGLPGSFAPHWAVPVGGRLPRSLCGATSALTSSRLARRSLTLRPARSLSRPTARPFSPECFSLFRYIHEPLRLLLAGTKPAQRVDPCWGACLSTTHEVRSSGT